MKVRNNQSRARTSQADSARRVEWVSGVAAICWVDCSDTERGGTRFNPNPHPKTQAASMEPFEVESDECRDAPLLVQTRGPRPGGARSLTLPVWPVPESLPGRRFCVRCCRTIPPRTSKAIRHYRQIGKLYLAWCLPMEKRGKEEEEKKRVGGKKNQRQQPTGKHCTIA